MKSLGDLLKRVNAPAAIGGPVSRALLLEAANSWLAAEIPGLAGRAEARSLVGDSVIVQCASGVLAAEVKLRSERLLAALRERYGAAAPRRLKCLVRQGNLDGY